MVTSFKRSHAHRMHSVPLTLQQATADPHLCWRLMDTQRQVWISLLWGHCFFLPGPVAHKVLFVPSKSLFLQSCVSFGSSVMGLMMTSSKRTYAIPRSDVPEPLPLWQATADQQLHRRHSNTILLSFCEVSGSWCAKGFFEPSEHLWWVWGLILTMIQPLLPSCWGFSFALCSRVSFFGGIQYSPVDSCS